jgi:hypothetical protein
VISTVTCKVTGKIREIPSFVIYDKAIVFIAALSKFIRNNFTNQSTFGSILF